MAKLTAYRMAVRQFDRLAQYRSPGEKLQHYLVVSRAICACVDRYQKKQREKLKLKREKLTAARDRQASAADAHDDEADFEDPDEGGQQRMEDAVIGADDLLLLFALVIVRGRCNRVSGIHAELRFVEELMTESQRANAAACYYHATFQAATELLRTIDKADIMHPAECDN
jgi:hypothetical protein